MDPTSNAAPNGDVPRGAAAARTGAVRRRSPRGDAARARILEIARESFATRGYRASSLNEIARLAQLSMPGLLHHFAGKDELFAAVLTEHERVDRGLLFSFMPEEPSGFEMFDAFVEVAKVNQGRFAFVQLMHQISAESTDGEHPGAEYAREHYATARRFVAEALRRSIERGEVHAYTDVNMIAAQVVGMVEGLENQWLHDQDAVDVVGWFSTWIAQLKLQLSTS